MKEALQATATESLWWSSPSFADHESQSQAEEEEKKNESDGEHVSQQQQEQERDQYPSVLPDLDQEEDFYDIEELTFRYDFTVDDNEMKEHEEFLSNFERQAVAPPPSSKNPSTKSSRFTPPTPHEIVAEREDGWNKHASSDLESAIQSGSIALVDALWLIHFAAQNYASSNNNRPCLPRRQDLPPEAFVSLDQVKWSTEGDECAIIMLSYMWLHPDHPDPKGETLQLLAWRLYDLIAQSASSEFKKYQRWAVFWDYLSLHQSPRTQPEDKLFRQGLQSSTYFYAHKLTHCWQITRFPRGYPHGYNLPNSPVANCKRYAQRGWPILEKTLANMSKRSREMSKDISGNESSNITKDIENGYTPLIALTPAQMEDKLKQAAFTNGKQDQQLVAQLYREYFFAHFGRVTTLDYRYSGAGMGDMDMVQITELLKVGSPVRLHEFRLRGKIMVGMNGYKALVSIIPTTLPGLRILDLSQTYTMGDDGCAALANVIVGGQLSKVILSGCGIGVAGCRALADAFEAKSSLSSMLEDDHLNCCGLRSLDIQDNPNIGDDGCAALAGLIVGQVEEINLTACDIGDEGCRALAKALTQDGGRPCHLQELHLPANKSITRSGMEYIGQLVRHCQNKCTLYLSRSQRTEELEEMEASGCVTLEVVHDLDALSEVSSDYSSDEFSATDTLLG